MAVTEYLQRVFGGTADEFCEKAGEAMLSGEKLFVITANPEIMMHAEREEDIRKILLGDKFTAITPDGVSVVKAMHTCGIDAKERVTGVDLAEKLLALAGKNGRSVYLLGAKEEVVSTLAKKLKSEHPDITVNFHNGYDGDKDEIFNEIAAIKPDLVLVALGVPAQERLIARHLDKFDKGMFVGVGGSFDVLSGLKQRAPAIFVKTNTEWLYRIVREPSRLKRFYRNNVKFLGEVKKAAKAAK